jgi:hypothetical protein
MTGGAKTLRFHKKGDTGGAGVITSCSYDKSAADYSRTLANSCRRSMLSSSGDFPRTLSSILSGEGLDEREPGKSPLVFLGWLNLLLGDGYRFQASTVDHRSALLLPGTGRPDDLSKIVPCLPLK